MNNSEIADRLSELHDAILVGLEEVRTILKGAQFTQAAVYQFPSIASGEDLPPVETISPTPIYGVEAFDSGLSSLTRTTARRGESTRYVFRLPGAISVSTSSDAASRLNELVMQINLAKKAFDTTAHKLTDEDARFQLLHTVFPGLIYPQLTRKLHLIDRPTKSITFTWGQKPSSSTITLEQADYRLAWHAANPSEQLLERLGISEAELISIAEQERMDLRRFSPETKIRHRRDLRVRPLANLLFADNETPLKKQYEAHTPIILLNSPESKIGLLKKYDKSKRDSRKKRQDSRASGTPISKILPFFLE